MTTIQLTVTGARTARQRTVELYAAVDGDAYVIVGSWGGRPKHPAWVHNLRANPRAKLRRGRDEWEVAAREAEGAERERLWDLLVAGFPTYARYQARTERRFAIFRLEPVG